MNEWIYLDNNATTPIEQEVIDAMVDELRLSPSNASSLHHFGQIAKARLATARKNIAAVIKASSEEIIFNSGATEAINTLLRGFCVMYPQKNIITTDIEHSCTYHTCKHLQQNGYDITFLQVDKSGAPSLKLLQDAIKENTALVILSAANAETGVKIDISPMAKMLKSKNISFVVDAVAMFGKEPFQIPEGVSAMIFSSHKFHGPQGIGFMYTAKDFTVTPQITGGLQEFSKRAGTENLPAIMGMAKAVELVEQKMPRASQHIKELQDRFETNLMQNLEGVWINGLGPRVSNTSNLGFENIDAESLLIHLDQAKIAVSHGSACASGAVEPSRVLLNMGISIKKAKSSLRFSFSRMNTQKQVDKAAEIVISLIKKMRKL